MDTTVCKRRVQMVDRWKGKGKPAKQVQETSRLPEVYRKKAIDEVLSNQQRSDKYFNDLFDFDQKGPKGMKNFGLLFFSSELIQNELRDAGE
eukprot:scaffold73097_cov13-Tisochrysis_lutea.AAC.1